MWRYAVSSLCRWCGDKQHLHLAYGESIAAIRVIDSAEDLVPLLCGAAQAAVASGVYISLPAPFIYATISLQNERRCDELSQLQYVESRR